MTERKPNLVEGEWIEDAKRFSLKSYVEITPQRYSGDLDWDPGAGAWIQQS